MRTSPATASRRGAAGGGREYSASGRAEQANRPRQSMPAARMTWCLLSVALLVVSCQCAASEQRSYGRAILATNSPAKAVSGAEILRLRGGVDECGGGRQHNSLSQQGPGRMFTGIRERQDKSPSALLAAMAPSAQVQPRQPIKFIYIVSDSTGFTASHALTSCMTQFEGLLVDYNRSDNTRAVLSLNCRRCQYASILPPVY